MIKAFFKDSAVYTIPAFLSRGLSLILVPLYTRVLSPGDYGALDLLTVFATIINLTIAMEVSQGVARFYSGETDTNRKVMYASSAFWFTVFCYSVFCIISILLSYPLSALVMGQKGMDDVFKIGVIYITINGIFFLIQNQFRWELRSKQYAIVSLLMTILTMAFSVLLAYVMHFGIKGLLWGKIIGVAIGSFYGLFYLRNSFTFRFSKKRLGEMLKYSIPLVPSGIAVWVSSYIDRMMINHFLNIEDVGLYGIGFRFASIVSLLLVGFRGALTPLIYTHYREKETPGQIAKIFRIFMSLAILLFLGLTLFSYDIVKLMTTPAFYSGACVVAFLVPSQLFSQMYIFAPGIGIAKKTYLLIWINIGGAILNIALNFILIPIYGIQGAAIATMLGACIVFIIKMLISQKLYYVPHQWGRIIFTVLLVSVLAFLFLKLRFFIESDLIRILIYSFGLVIVAVLCVLFRLVRYNEIHYILKNLRSSFMNSSKRGL